MQPFTGKRGRPDLSEEQARRIAEDAKARKEAEAKRRDGTNT